MLELVLFGSYDAKIAFRICFGMEDLNNHSQGLTVEIASFENQQEN